MNQARPSPLSPLSLTATWFGSGLLPVMPGTWGALAALPFAAAIQWLGGPAALMLAAMALLAVGIAVADRYVAASGEPDCQAIVVDEVVGQWVTLVPLGLDPLSYLVGFASFRLFDTTKPWPVHHFERLPGGWGVMLDDVAAAGYAGLLGWLALTAAGYR